MSTIRPGRKPSWSPPQFQDRGTSVDEAGDFLAEACQDARLGDADGIRGQAQVSGGFTGGLAFQYNHPEGLPGCRLKLRLDELKEPADHMSVVLLVPAAAKVA